LSHRTDKFNWTKTKKRIQEPSQYTSSKFLALRTTWYKKLKRLGFQDIEFHRKDGVTTDTLLINSLSNLKRKHRPETAYYFQKAGWYLFNGWFKNEREHKFWIAHIEGKSNHQIAREIGCSKETVRVIIAPVKKRMLLDTRYEDIEAQQIAEMAKRFDFVIKKLSSDE
jgi:hypothetical protein